MRPGISFGISDFEIVIDNNFEIETFILQDDGQEIDRGLVRCSSFYRSLRPYFAILRMREL